MFYFEMYYDSCFLTEEHGYRTYEEAQEEAENAIKDRIDMWKAEGSWADTDSEDRFSFEIEEEEASSYMYELYYVGCYLDDGHGFGSPEEAKYAGKKEAFRLWDEWRKNGRWNVNYDSLGHFEVFVDEDE